MQRNEEYGEPFLTSLCSWQSERLKEREKEAKATPKFAPLIGVFVAALTATLFSFLLFNESTATGGFLQAAAVFEELAEENSAIAVFLGLGENDDGEKMPNEDIRQRAEEYMEKHTKGEE